MNKFFFSLIALAILAGGYFLFYRPLQEEPVPVSMETEAPPPRVPAPVAPPEPPPPAPREFPVPEVAEQAEPEEPLPQLDESDVPVEEEFNRLVGDEQLDDLLLFNAFIRNFVVVVDNMTARILPQKYLFFRPPPGQFLVERPSLDEIVLDPENYKRYAPYVRLAGSLDLDEFVNVYVYLYPLFQQAYEDLGYPERYFNDRLIEVIDHLLATPVVEEAPGLIQPKVYYQFEDPALEALSAGQKLLIRIGPENSALIRTRLGELRQKLTSLDKQDYNLSVQ
jgi:hypothetical protein